MSSRETPSACAISSSASSRGVSLSPASRAAAAVKASRTFIEARQPLGLVLGDQRADQLVQLALQYLGQPVERKIDPVVGHPPLREIVGADALRSVARADHRLA